MDFLTEGGRSEQKKKKNAVKKEKGEETQTKIVSCIL